MFAALMTSSPFSSPNNDHAGWRVSTSARARTHCNRTFPDPLCCLFVYFADDAAAFLLFTTFKIVSHYLWLWARIMTEFRMIINFPKTKVMIFWATRAQASWGRRPAPLTSHRRPRRPRPYAQGASAEGLPPAATAPDSRRKPPSASPSVVTSRSCAGSP